MTRAQAEAQFWDDVRELLSSEYGHSDHVARKGIDSFRQEVKRRGGVDRRGRISGVVYNKGEEETARIADFMIANNFRMPSP